MTRTLNTTTNIAAAATARVDARPLAMTGTVVFATTSLAERCLR
jgi:hypothetical protein